MTEAMPPRRTLPNGSGSWSRVSGSWSGNLAPSATTTIPNFLPPARRRVSTLDQVGQVDGDLGDEDVIGRRGHAREAGDPAGVAAHRLDHHHAAMALGRGPEPIDGLGHDVDGGVEAEREVRERQVVVDRLGDADDRQLEVVVEADGDAQRVVAADDHQGVEAERGEVRPQRGEVGLGVLVGIGPRRAEDRPALADDAVGLARPRGASSDSGPGPASLRGCPRTCRRPS